MTTELMELCHKVAGFSTSFPDLVRSQNLLTPGAPIPGASNKGSEEEKNVDVGTVLHSELWFHQYIDSTPILSLMM